MLVSLFFFLPSMCVFKADLVFFFRLSIHLADARIQTSADNLTENVKFILTSECTINVILICIRNDGTDDWMARMEMYSILCCLCNWDAVRLLRQLAASRRRFHVRVSACLCRRRRHRSRGRRLMICEIVSSIAIEWQSIYFLWIYLFDQKPPAIDCASRMTCADCRVPDNSNWLI